MRGDPQFGNYFRSKNDAKYPPINMRPLDSPVTDKRFKPENWARKYAA